MKILIIILEKTKLRYYCIRYVYGITDKDMTYVSYNTRLPASKYKSQLRDSRNQDNETRQRKRNKEDGMLLVRWNLEVRSREERRESAKGTSALRGETHTCTTACLRHAAQHQHRIPVPVPVLEPEHRPDVVMSMFDAVPHEGKPTGWAPS